MKQPLPVFFDTEMAVFGAPSRYLQGVGILDRVGPLCAGLGENAVLVTDGPVRAIVESKIAKSCSKVGVSTTTLVIDGELTTTVPALMHEAIASLESPVVIACGGGRAIDTGKALAHRLDAKLITAPTAASNDAPTSKNYVFYDDCHRLVEIGNMPRNPDFVLVDTAVLARAPKQLFAAGLGDAIAKFSEARSCAETSGINMFRARPTRTALAIAATCEQTLVECGRDAFDAAGTGEVTPAFEAAVEAMILMAGLGFENGGLSIAHAMTRGLSLVNGSRSAPHGFQVAYGLRVQCALEERELSSQILALYRHVGLPLNFRDLAGRGLSQSDIDLLVPATLAAPHSRNFPGGLTEQQLTVALHAVEASQNLATEAAE